MNQNRRYLFLAVVVSLWATPLARAQGFDRDPNLDLVRRAGIGPDSESLISYLEAIPPDESLLSRLDQFIAMLRSDKFGERREALRSLIALRSMAVGPLTIAAKSENAEIRRNATRCLQQIQKSLDPNVLKAAIQLLVQRAAPDAATALLTCLPTVPNYELEEEISFALDCLTKSQSADESRSRR